MLANQLTTFPPRVVSKPTGGFHPINVSQVYMAWWAYRTGHLPRYLDFRVYLALHEVAECRLAASRARKRKVPGTLIPVPPRKELVAELRTLVGGKSDRLVRAALTRLESKGLVTLTRSFLRLAAGPEALVNAPAELVSMLNRRWPTPANGGRRLPVPRRVLKLLARSATPSLAATVFGYLIRCVWWRDSELHVHGSCTAAFVSERFGVDPRSVKRARSELRRIGWLATAGTGGLGAEAETLPNLAWSGVPKKCGSGQGESGTVLSSLPVKRDTKMSPLSMCTQLRSGSKYQQLTGCREAGNRKGGEPIRNPRLANVRPWDLSSAARLSALFEEAGSAGLVGRSFADRLRFFAAAARATRLGTENPCGFFAAIVQKGLWDFVCQADEDAALARLRRPDENLGSGPRQSRGIPKLQQNRSLGCEDRGELQRLILSVAAQCSMSKGQKLRYRAVPAVIRAGLSCVTAAAYAAE